MPVASFALAFQWQVAEGGHRIVKKRPIGEDTEVPLITHGIPAGASGRWRRYFPFEDHTGLFRQFAALPRDEAAIIGFANRYGLLGGSAVSFNLYDPTSEKEHLTAGEKISRWRNEAEVLRRCIQLCEWAEKGDTEKIAQYITWTDKGVSYRSHPKWNPGDGLPVDLPVSFTTIASSLIEDANLEKFRPGDVIKPALFYVQKEINSRLHEETRLRILWDRELNELNNCAVPASLLGAIWLQFALSVERKTSFRQCPECGTWFEVSAKTARSDKIFCSTACRVKASRRRRAAGTEQDAAENTPAKAGRARRGPGRRSGRAKQRNQRR